MRRRALRSLIILVVSIAAALVAFEAHADSYFKLVRITCLPDAGYAAVETFGLYNIDDAAGRLPSSLISEGVYELEELARAPVACDLPKGKLLIEVFNYREAQATAPSKHPYFQQRK